MVRLPSAVFTGDGFALTSLAAALLLGLRERLGGAPDHLEVATIVDPTPNGPSSRALLLHDTIPGGTGYLTELADPVAVWGLLHGAWQILDRCPCQFEGKLACEKCLLPFAGPSAVRTTSRATAERHLRAILTAGTGDGAKVPAQPEWKLTETQPPAKDPESELEQRFRQAFRARLETMGATIVETPTAKGSVWTISLGGGNVWSLRPQENVGGARPDFLLTSGRANVPPTAIFTDGFAFHASAAHNRVADDAAKRENLRGLGYQVLAITWADIDPATPVTPPPWFGPVARELLLGAAGDRLSPAALDTVNTGSFGALLAWVQSPQYADRAAMASLLPLALVDGGAARLAGHRALTAVALDVLDGTHPGASGLPNGAVWHHGAVAVVIRIDERAALSGGAAIDYPASVAVVFDDNDANLGIETKSAWQEWLRISNLLNFRSGETIITTRSRLAVSPLVGSASAADSVAPTQPVGARAGSAPATSSAWGEVLELASPGREWELLNELMNGGLSAPELGHEVDGNPLDIAWPELQIAAHDAIDSALDEGWIAALREAGWTVLPLDQAAISAAHTAKTEEK